MAHRGPGAHVVSGACELNLVQEKLVLNILDVKKTLNSDFKPPGMAGLGFERD